MINSNTTFKDHEANKTDLEFSLGMMLDDLLIKNEGPAGSPPVEWPVSADYVNWNLPGIWTLENQNERGDTIWLSRNGSRLNIHWPHSKIEFWLNGKNISDE